METRSPGPDEFCRVWETSSSPAEAARRLGMNPRTAKARAVDYRRRGIELQKFRDNEPLDVQSLAQTVRALKAARLAEAGEKSDDA